MVFPRTCLRFRVCIAIWLNLTLLVFHFSGVDGVTDLVKIDSDISAIYETQEPSRKQELLDDMHLYLITLRRYNTMVMKDEETREEAWKLVHSGGPKFLNHYKFYSDEEQKLRYKMNFTDYHFQEYQYYRLDTESEWAELKEKIAQIDKERARDVEPRIS